MNPEPPTDYLTLLAAYDAAMKRWGEVLARPSDKKRCKAAAAEANKLQQALYAHPDHAFVLEVQKDDLASYHLVLRRQPRTVTLIACVPGDAPHDHEFSDSVYPESLYDLAPDKPAITLLIDSRQTTASQVIELLQATIRRIEDSGILVSIGPSPFDDRMTLYVNERTDGSMRGETFLNDEKGR